MPTTGILRARRSAAQLHAIASVEREIRAIDRAAGRKYLRDFREAYRSYQKVLTPSDVRRQIASAGIVLVGDYHALPNSQRYLAALFRDPELHQRPVVLGVETIFSRNQHILDEWFRAEIAEDELRQRIRFELDWGYDWPPFYELLSAARDHGASIYGLDCMPREDLRKIAARDRHAADKIAELRRRHPGALILVLFGESHLAPQHLPALLRQRLPAEPVLTVLQNVDALYWRAAGEAGDHVEAVEVRNELRKDVHENVLCVFNATPLEKYENYRLCLDRWARNDNDRSAPDLGPTLYNLIGGMVRFLGINQYSAHNTTQPRLLVDLMPEVYSRSSDALLRRLLSRKGFTAEHRRSLLRQVRERGSVYLPPINAVYVRQFRMTSSAEDATRFLHQACRGLPNLSNGKAAAQHTAPHAAPVAQSLARDDAFYVAVFEHALAFFGSRILHPARPALRDADLADLFDVTREDLEHQTSLSFAAAVEALDFLIQHRERVLRYNHSYKQSHKQSHKQRRRRQPSAAESFAPAPAFTGRQYEYVVQQLGYLTGNDLYDAYLEGRLTTAAMRQLFLTHIEQPGVARAAYLQLRTQLRK
ncbi:MAG TPA: ChaN family lipoprotein [Candidatus Acidoferrales bacterium]|nr:ChaN family lipoprotein [Candidatus Acidoferrales bacterium]